MQMYEKVVPCMCVRVVRASQPARNAQRWTAARIFGVSPGELALSLGSETMLRPAASARHATAG